MDWNSLASQNLPSLSLGRGGGDGGGSSSTTTFRHSDVLRTLNPSATAATLADDSAARNHRSATWAFSSERSVGNNNETKNSRWAAPDEYNTADAHTRALEERIAAQLQESTELRQQRREAALEAQMQANWEKKRDEMVRRILGDGYGVMPQSPPAGTTHAARTPLVSTLVERGGGSNTLASWPNTSLREHPSSMLGSNLTLSRTGTNFGGRWPSADQQPLDRAFVQKHAQVLQSMATSTSARALVQQLQMLPQQRNSGYAAALGLCAHLVTTSGNALSLATATCGFLATQFADLITQRLRQANLASQHVVYVQRYTNAFANQIAAFVELVLGHMTPQGAATWAVLFYCLRCGDAQAAWSVWQSERDLVNNDSALEAAALQRVLQVRAHTQRGTASVWEATAAMSSDDDNNNARLSVSVSPRDQELLKDACEGWNTQGNDAVATFQLAVYALVSGGAALPTGASGSSPPGLNTTEDYLYGMISQVLLGTGGSNAAVLQLEEIGRWIGAQGPAAFGNDMRDGGYSWALPLLATQQYEQALSHVAQMGGANGLAQVAHIALVLAVSNIKVENLGQSPRDSRADVATSILVAYAHKLASDPSGSAPAALLYLVRIPDTMQARKEIAIFLATAGNDHVGALAGTLDDQGVRQAGSPLDQYFDRSTVADILFRAGLLLSKSASDLSPDREQMGTAARCYMLAGRFTEVVRLLNSLLSPPDREDENRKYWLDQCEDFYIHYLSKRTPVLEALERDNRQDVVDTNRMLVNLNSFFVLLRSERYAEAWTLSSQLDLLPQTQHDLSTMESRVRNLDPTIQCGFMAFLLGTMELLHWKFRQLKLTDPSQIASTGVAKESIADIQAQSKMLMSVANLYPGQNLAALSKMSSLQAQII